MTHSTDLKIEIQQGYNRFQSELQSLATKVSELESDADEHSYVRNTKLPSYCLIFSTRLVLKTLSETLQTEPDRKCFHLIGGVLTERTVKDVVPTLQGNLEQVRS